MFLGFCALTLSIYAGGLKGPFLYDDHAYITGNPTIKNLGRALATFGRPEALTDGSFNHLAYRPLMPIIYAFLFSVFGMNPAGYHLFNLLIHSLNAWLVFLLLSKLKIPPIPAVLASALWLAHPVNVENVQGITGLDDLLSAAFALGAILWALDNRLRVALPLFAAGIACKEGALIAPVLLSPLLILRMQDRPMLQKIKATALRIAPFVAIGFAFMLIRRHFISFDDTKAPVQGLMQALLVMPRILFTYLRLLILPVRLRINYFFDLNNLVDFLFFASCIVMATLTAAAFVLRKRVPLFTAGLAWFFIAFLPVSNLIPLRALAGERFMYLPYVGFAIAGAGLSASLVKYRKAAVAGAVIVTLLFSLAAAARVKVWCDEERFWKDIIAKEPGFSIYQMYESNLANCYLLQKQYNKAEILLKRILRNKPDCIQCAHNLAQTYLITKQYARAVSLFEQLLTAQPINELFADQLAAAQKGLASSQTTNGVAP